MTKLYDPTKKFEYENGFYATTDAARLSKFISHLEFFKRTSTVRGEIVECGVFKGNSLFRWIKFRDLLEQTKSRGVIGFDVFGAFPETQFEGDVQKREAFIKETNGGVGISLQEANELLKSQNLDENVSLIKGDICSTLANYVDEHPHLKISLLHIDVDIYEPVKVILELLYPKVTKGGIIVLDDYGAFAGTNKAVDDYFKGEAIVKKLPYSNAIGYIEK